MKIVLVILLVALLALAWRLNSTNATLVRQQQTLSRQQQQIQTLTTALADKSKQEAAALQEKCSETASKFFSSSAGYKNADGFDYKNHFNSKLNKCFILVSSYLHKANAYADFSSIDLYDAVEGKRYAQYNGHFICDVALTKNPRKCIVDSGRIWFDGNDTRNPPDFTVGFRGLLYGGGAGDENTQKTFLDHIQPFMSE
jgi:hypothetical protein